MLMRKFLNKTELKSALPEDLKPVLAQIEGQKNFVTTTWYELVYYDGKWKSYLGSLTFKNAEKVLKWKYIDECFASEDDNTCIKYNKDDNDDDCIQVIL